MVDISFVLGVGLSSSTRLYALGGKRNKLVRKALSFSRLPKEEDTI